MLTGVIPEDSVHGMEGDCIDRSGGYVPMASLHFSHNSLIQNCRFCVCLHLIYWNYWRITRLLISGSRIRALVRPPNRRILGAERNAVGPERFTGRLTVLF